jgi:hypothetical protein
VKDGSIKRVSGPQGLCHSFLVRTERLIVVSLLAIFGFLAFTQTAHAFHQVNVTATVTRVTNKLNRCFDPLVVGCSRPDYYAVITIESNSKDPSQSCSFRKELIENRDTITPTTWTCSARMENPIVVVNIWDFDGNKFPDLADIVAGPGESLRVPVTRGTTSITSVGDDTNVMIIITATREPSKLFPPLVNQREFDPSLNETITISGAVDHQTRLKIRTNSTLGRADIGDINVNGPFMFVWNGTFIGGTAAPVAIHDIIVAGEGGNPVISSSPPTEIINGINLIKRPPNSLAILSSFPATKSKPRWNPRAGPLKLEFLLSSSATVELDITNGNACPITTSLETISSSNLNPGTSSLSWDGTILRGGSRQFVPKGIYTVALSATFSNGLPNVLVPREPCFQVEVIDPPPLEIAVESSPIVALLGEPMMFTATALDAEHADRLTGTIEIWVADVIEVGAHRPPTTPVMTCRQSSVCSVSIITATPTTGRVAFKAVAHDILGSFVQTPWRMAEVIDPSMIGTGAIVMAGVPMDFGPSPPVEFFGRFNQSKTIDTVYFPGNFDMSADGSDPTVFRGIVADHIKQLWGLGPQRRFPSTFLANQDNVSFWVALKNATVVNSNPFDPDPNNACSYGASTPPWSEVNAIVHRTPCRDNSKRFFRLYSAKSPLISWHEMHHVAFGLADEYCCDGGYWQQSIFPNVYLSHVDCVADPLSGFGSLTCQPIRDNNVFTCPISGQVQGIRGWRLDSDTDICVNNTPDVMINNTIELGADTRRASHVFSECDQGKC